MSNVTVTTSLSNVTTSSSLDAVTVSSTLSNVTVGETTFVANSTVRAALGNVEPILYDISTGIFSLNTDAVFSNVLANAWFTTQTTNNLTEGSNNLYYSNARVNAYIVDNGLDFNAVKVDDRVANLIVATNGITSTYDKPANTLTISQNLTTDQITEGANNKYFTTTGAAINTTALTEGTNLYYTDVRSRLSVSAVDLGGDGSFSYNNSTGQFTYYGPLPADYRGHVSALDNGGDGSFSYNEPTGVFTYTGPSASEVRAHFSATNDSGYGTLAYDSATGVFSLAGVTDAQIRERITASTVGTGYGDLSYQSLSGQLTYTPVTDANILGSVKDNELILKHYAESIVDLTSQSGQIDIDLSTGSLFDVSLTGNITNFNFSNITDFTSTSNWVGGNSVTIILRQDGLGFRELNLASSAWNQWEWVNNYKTLSKGANEVDVLTVTLANSKYFASIAPLKDAVDFAVSGNITAGTNSTNLHVLTGNTTITGNLQVSGQIDYVTSKDLLVNDQSISLNVGNVAQDAMIIVDRTGSGAGANTEVRWNETTDKWTFSNDGSTYNNLLTLADIPASGVTSVNTYTGPAVTLGTDDIAEGATNLYYTNARADARVNLQTGTNLDLSSKSTTDLAEGTNLYYTDTRSRAAVSLATPASASGGGALAYNSATGAFTFTPAVPGVGLTGLSTSTGTPSGGGSLSYNNATGVFTFSPSIPGIAFSDISTTTASASGNGALSYNNSTGAFTFTPADTSLATKSTTDLAEGTNLYYTDARVATKIDSYVVGSENITVTSGAIATKPALGSTNSITTEASSGFAINSSDGTTVTSKFGADSTVTETANISGKGYAILNSLGTEGIVTYSGASSFEWYILSGSTTAGSTTLTITSLIRGIDGTAASITDLNVGQVINNGQNVTFPIDAYVVSINSGAGTVTMSQPAISSYAFGTLTAGAFVSGTTYQILTLGDTDWSLVGAPQVVPNNIQTGTQYIINSVGDTDFTAIGASSNNPDVVFTATGAGSGTGTVIATNFTATGAGAGTGTAAETTQTILDAGMIDTTTGLVVALYSSLRSTGSGSDSAIAQIDTLNYPFGYPATGPEANDFDIFTTGAVTDYAIGDYSAYTVGQTPLTNSRTVLNAPLGITIGENTQLTNRGENDRFQSYGMNMMWDGLTSSTRTIQPQVLFKSYTDNASQSSASLLASGAPRLFFSSANGNANDNPYDAYPRTNQELGRLSFWGSTGTQLTPSSYNVPGFISVAAADNWDTWGGQAAGNTNVYMGATSNGSNPDTYLAYKSGELILGGGNSKPVTLAPAYNGSATNPQIAYSGTQTTWANVNYANTGTNTGAKFSVTNGGSVDAGTVGDMQMSLKRVDNSSTGSASPSTVISSGFLGGSTNEIYIRFLPADAPPLQNYATTMTGITSSASGNEVALNGVQKHLAYVPTGQYQGYEWFKIFDNASYSTATTYTSLGGSAGYNQASQSGANAPYVISSGVTGREWKLNLAEQSEDLVLSSNDVAKVTFNNDVSIFSNRIRFQNLTTTEINALTGMTAGDTVYNTTEKTLCFYNGDASNGWQKVSHANL